MKKTTFFAVCFILAMCLLPACTTYQHTSRQTSIETRQIAAHQMTADMTVDFTKKVTGESRRDCRSRKEAINDAVHNAIINSNADIVVDPIFEFEIKQRFGYFEYYAKTVGFAGYYQKAENSDELVKDVKEAAELTEEDIVKYKLLTEPDFSRIYYRRNHQEKKQQHQGNSTSTVINFNNGDGTQQVTTPAATTPKKGQAGTHPAKQKKERRDNKKKK